MIAELTNHLWQSTLFAVAAGLLTVAFRTNKAQVRYWLWFSASVKFLLPFALLMSLGSHLKVAPAVTQFAVPVVSDAMLQIAVPFPGVSSFVPAAQRSIDWVPIAIFVWACGFAAIVVIRLKGWLRIRAAVRSSIPLDLPGAIAVRSSPDLLEPGVVGFLRPVLLLPAGIQERLTPRQLEAVLAHELCHVHRRDNLTSAVHMIVEAVFWFHPLVWWIGTRLVEERERACDEAVLSLGGEPRIYAEGILSVCKNYLESPLRCVSGVTGADLKKRIHTILTGRVPGDLNSARKAVLAIVAILTLAAPLIVGVMNAPLIRAQSAARPQFEVASIKRCVDDSVPGGRGGGLPSFSPGRMTLNCQSVMGLINAAYVMYANGRNFNLLKLPHIPIEGGPGWIDSEKYTINAKAEDKANAYAMQGPLLQTLLENRFKLKIHRESREIPIYELVVAKGGPKLKPFQEGTCTPMPPLDLTTFPQTYPTLPPGQHYCQMAGGAAGPNMGVHMEGISLDDFAHTFPSARPVVNKTGIKGIFDISLKFGIDDDARQRMTEIAGADPGESTEPPVFTAIQEQLGLKLEPAKGPGEFLVIDSIERPSEN